MASAVVLDSDVRLVASTGESAGACGASFPKFWVAEETGHESAEPSDDDDEEPWWLGESSEEEEVKPKGLVDWIREGLVKMSTETLVTNPEIHALSLHLPAVPREIVAQLEHASILSADKSLLTLYTGQEWYNCASSGRYLVCDVATTNALFAAPPIDLPYGFRPDRPVVMRHSEGFILALLVSSWLTRQHSMLLWTSSPSALEQQWLLKDAIPKDVVEYGFDVDVALAYHGRWACWVDLHKGILTCDMQLPEPQFQLKPLPMKAGLGSRGNPCAYSTVGCVDGKLRFLYMHGFDVCRDGEEVPNDEITIMNWTLEGSFPDDCEWVKDNNKTLTVGELWGDEAFRASPGPPKCVPTVPVLSPKEPDVIYFILNDENFVDQYALSLNVQSKKVQSWTKCSENSLKTWPTLVTADLGAYKESSKSG